MKNSKTRIMMECSVLIALSVVLSFIILYTAPFGGTVTCFSMVPLVIISIRHGVVWGMGSAFVYSVFELIRYMGYVTAVPSLSGIIAVVLLDYIVAFTLIGLSGLFRNIKVLRNEKANMGLATFTGVILAFLLRFFCHFISGAVVWYEITKNASAVGDYVRSVGMWTYSFVYNITYLGPEALLTLIAVPVVVLLLKCLKKA